MGIRLRADFTTPAPHPVSLRLVCDGNHGLLDAPIAQFDVTNGDPRAPALAAGWKFTPDGPVLCPQCARSSREASN